MTAIEVSEFFTNYAKAFSEQNIEAICELWDYPAFLSIEGQEVVLDPGEFFANTKALCSFHAAQGVVRATKQVLELARLTHTTASVRTQDQLYDQDGELAAEWEHVYLLSRTARRLKAAAATLGGELAAWRARGTPLGGPSLALGRLLLRLASSRHDCLNRAPLPRLSY